MLKNFSCLHSDRLGKPVIERYNSRCNYVHDSLNSSESALERTCRSTKQNELMSLTHQLETEFIFSLFSCFCCGLLASSSPQFSFQGCSYFAIRALYFRGANRKLVVMTRLSHRLNAVLNPPANLCTSSFAA